MNRGLSLLLSIMTGACATVSFASEELCCFRPYFGAEAQWRQMSFHKGFGDNLFKQDYPQGNLFLGIKANEYVGLELGYEVSKKRHRSNTLSAGDIVTGGVAPGQALMSSNAQFHGPHMDLVGYLPIRKPPSPHSEIDLLASIGVVYLKGHFVTNFLPNGAQPVTRTFSGTRNMLRLGLGIQNMLSCDVGIRFLINWENTAKLKLTNKETTATTNPLFVRPKNSIIYSLGLFVIW